MRSFYLQISSAGTFGCLEQACSLCVRMQQDGIFELAVRCRCCSVVLKLVNMWMFIKKSDEELILKLMKKYILISLHPLLACGNIRNPSLNVIFDSFFTSSISSALDGWAALLRKPLQFTPGKDWYDQAWLQSKMITANNNNNDNETNDHIKIKFSQFIKCYHINRKVHTNSASI